LEQPPVISLKKDHPMPKSCDGGFVELNAFLLDVQHFQVSATAINYQGHDRDSPKHRTIKLQPRNKQEEPARSAPERATTAAFS
jgi:hypothetical protein